MAPKKKEIPTGPLGIAGSSAVLGLALVSFALMAAGLASDVWKWNKENDIKGRQQEGCYSLWGSKQCGMHPIAHADWMIKTCGVFEACLKAACSMAVVTLFGNLMVVIMALCYTLRKLTNKTPLLIFCVFTTITAFVPWTVVCGLTNNSTCGYPSLKYVSSYSTGFYLFVISFCCAFLNIILAALS